MSFYNSLKFKVGVIHSDSIGKLLAHTEYYLRKQASKDNLETSFFVAGKPILPYALKMYRRKTIIFQNHFFYIFFKKMQEFFPELNCWADLNRNGFYDWKIWDESAPQLEFNKKDLQKGSRLLMRMGIGHEAEYVCVHIRDNKYSDSFKKRDPWWEDNDFRDCSAENYLSVIEYLAQKGIYTIRLGNADSPPINVKNKYFIDYATRYQSAFGDVFLPGTCKFLLGNPSGVYFLATVFNVPVALSNMAPFGECGRRTKDVFILKKLFDIHRQKYVPFREIEQLEQNPISGKLLDEERRTNWKKRVNGLFYSRLSRQQIVELEDKGLSFHENTPEEILGLVREMNERIDGKFVIPDDYKDLQRMHLQIFPEEHPLRSSPPGSPIAYDFMKRNIQLWK